MWRQGLTSGFDQDLAEMLPVFEALVGGADFGERKNRIDHGLQLAAEDELQDAVQFAHGAHERAQQAPLFAEEVAQVDGGVETGGGATSGQATGGGEGFQALLPGGLANVLDHDIDAAPGGDFFDLAGDVLAVVIDGIIGAQGAGFRQFGLAAGSGDDAALEKPGDLDGGHADAARGGQDENVFTGLQPGAGHQHVPGGEEDQGGRGGIFEGHGVRDLDDAVFGRGQEVRIAAIRSVAEDGIAAAKVVVAGQAVGALAAAQARRKQDAPAGADAPAEAAGFDDFARDVAAEDVGHGELHARNARAHKEVEVVEGAGAHPDEDVAGADPGFGCVFVDEDGGVAVVMDSGEFHGESLARSLGRW